MSSLVAAGLLTMGASLAHLGCIALGAPAYRAMGAGERMARAVERGSLRPAIVTLGIAAVLAVWALYALGGAGLIARLPFTKAVLPAVAAVFLLRGLAFPWLRPHFPENSIRFWIVSSAACLILACLFGLGAVEVWSETPARA